MYFQLIGIVGEKNVKKRFVGNSTQCNIIGVEEDNYEKDEKEEKEKIESTLEILKQEYEDNLQLAKEHMEQMNMEGLAMLKTSLEADHNKMMKIMEEGLQRNFEESTSSLTKAHEAEVNHSSVSTFSLLKY